MIPWLRWLQRRLEKKDAVLELGCGMGIPAARFLARNYSYRGVDISDIQIKRADMSRLKFLRESFRAIVSFYAVILSAPSGTKTLVSKNIPMG
jgi:SAM-dependent methyltransferase